MLKVKCPKCRGGIISYAGHWHVPGGLKWLAECCECGEQFFVIDPDRGQPRVVKLEKKARWVERELAG